MKKITFIVLLCLPAYLISQVNTDDLDLADKILKVKEENILRSALYHNWGSSIIKGEDGKYHLFYAQMSKEIGFKSWLTDGIVSHAVSDSVSGPYVHKEVVLKGRGFGHWDTYTAYLSAQFKKITRIPPSAFNKITENQRQSLDDI